MAFFGLFHLIRICVGFVLVEMLWHKTLFKIIVLSVIDCLSAMGTFTSSALVYLFIVKVIYCEENEYFEKIIQMLTKHDHERDIKCFLVKLVKQRQLLNDVKTRLVNCLSFLPLLWFCHLFLYIAGVAVFAQRRENNLVLFDCLTDGLNIVYEITIVITIMTSIDEINQLIQKKIREICDVLIDNPSYFIIEGGLRDLKESCATFEFSVCNLFTLNKRLFLGFLSSLLTFTTLFIQIADNIYSSMH